MVTLKPQHRKWLKQQVEKRIDEWQQALYSIYFLKHLKKKKIFWAIHVSEEF